LVRQIVENYLTNAEERGHEAQRMLDISNEFHSMSVNVQQEIDPDFHYLSTMHQAFASPIEQTEIRNLEHLDQYSFITMPHKEIFYLHCRGAEPSKIIPDKNTATIPTFSIAATGSASMNLPQCRQEDVKRAIMSKVAMERDKNLITLLNKSAAHRFHALELNIDNITSAIGAIEKAGEVCTRMFVNAAHHASLCRLNDFERGTQRDVIMSGLLGHIYNTDVFQCQALPYGIIILTGLGNEVGEFNTVKSISLETNHQPNMLKYEWIAWEHICAFVKNPNVVAVIKLAKDIS
jgi:hypothetical protein